MPDMFVLVAVYDNSDIMTDYFQRDAPIGEWFVHPLAGKIVNEVKLRRILLSLPEWLQHYTWSYQKGEKYSMSDHPYGQLRVATDLRFPCSAGGTSPVLLILGVTWQDNFKMNYSLTDPIPESFDVMRLFIEGKIREREERAQKYKEAQERAKVVPADKTPVELRAIFDGLNESEKVGVAFGMFPVRLQALTRNDIVGLMKLREEVGPRMTFDGA